MATTSLDTAPVGEVDMGDELEDDLEEADCYHLNKKSECSLSICGGGGHEVLESTLSRDLN